MHPSVKIGAFLNNNTSLTLKKSSKVVLCCISVREFRVYYCYYFIFNGLFSLSLQLFRKFIPSTHNLLTQCLSIRKGFLNVNVFIRVG